MKLLEPVACFTHVLVVLLLLQVVNCVIISAPSLPHQRTLPQLPVDLFCNADSVIDNCQFNIWDDGYKTELSVIDVASLTNQWVMDADSQMFGVREYGIQDMTQGLCGMSLMGLPEGRYVIGCRVRVEEGPWVYHTSTLYVSELAGNMSDLAIQPEATVFESPGSDVNVTCSTTNGACDFLTDSGRTTRENLDTLECGVTVSLNQSSETVWCREVEEHNAIGTIIVALEPPTEPPRLKFITERYVNNSIFLEAMCSIMESRPAANITWYLGDRVVSDVHEELVMVGRWAWSWDAEGRSQMLKMKLTDEDNGKNVTCEATHLGLTESLTTTKTLVIQTVSANALKMNSIDAGVTSGNTQEGLTTGGLVGILLTVLVLVAVVVAVVAHAYWNQRWCFRESFTVNNEPIVAYKS